MHDRRRNVWMVVIKWRTDTVSEMSSNSESSIPVGTSNGKS